MITNDRRAFKRVNKRLTVAFKLHGIAGAYAGTSITKNISLGGVYFTSLKRFDIGQLLDCRIKIPGLAEENKWVGRVVRCEDIGHQVVGTYGIAIEFIKSFGNSEKNLKKIIERK